MIPAMERERTTYESDATEGGLEVVPVQGPVGLAEADQAAEEPKHVLVDPEPVQAEAAGSAVLVVRVTSTYSGTTTPLRSNTSPAGRV